ncbi:hypothetical protein ACFCX0_46385 [Streptomyces sp. NPDC056352]|uniref:hypothetical protein n=1 Tax=Streptomyces sp. NPDC056352 TaxID=3345791 RepID=UPI0035E345AC
MQLLDLDPLMVRRRDNGLSLVDFRVHPAIASLQWPDDVVEQWLFDHGDNASFLRDYGGIDLREVEWSLETISAEELYEMPTGASDDGCIEHFAANPDHWVGVRPPDVGLCWEEHGTWMRPPILIDRSLLDPRESGLQVVEGRTRVGVLKGRRRKGAFVARQHRAWAGRAKSRGAADSWSSRPCRRPPSA